VAAGAGYGGVPETTWRGQRVLHPDRGGWRALAEALLADGWEVCVDLTAADYLTAAQPRPLPGGVAPERFEVVANLVSLSRRERVRLRVQVPEADPTIDSLCEVYPGVDAAEREVFDMFGIVFAGHPDLSRILMPETWQGHPLRKDYALGAVPVQFKGTPPSR
jgi:NADH-quinone oxidoreductase subunit C